MSTSTCPSDDTVLAELRSVVPQATAAWLYGSAAQDHLRADSDIDIAVLLPQAMSGQQKWDWSCQLSMRFKREVDLVDFQNISCVLQKEIFAKGRRLFALQPFNVDLIELHALSQYRAYNARYASEFERIARTGRVYA